MFKKPLIMKLMVLIFIVSLLASCGGGGGGGSTPGGGTGDTMTVIIANPASTTTYNEAAFDPLLTGTVSGTPQKTYVDMCSGITNNGGCTKAVNMAVDGITAPKIYNTSTVTKVTYTDGSKIYSSTSGTLTLTTLGVVGERITGSFDNVVVANVSNVSDILTISGTFSVTRE